MPAYELVQVARGGRHGSSHGAHDVHEPQLSGEVALFRPFPFELRPRRGNVLRARAPQQQIEPPLRVGHGVCRGRRRRLRVFELLCGDHVTVEEGLVPRELALREPDVVLGLGERGAREGDVLWRGACLEFREIRLELPHPGFALLELGLKVHIGEPGDHVARPDLLPFVHKRLGDDPLDGGPDVRVLLGQNHDGAPDAELHVAEGKPRDNHNGERRPRHPPPRAALGPLTGVGGRSRPGVPRSVVGIALVRLPTSRGAPEQSADAPLGLEARVACEGQESCLPVAREEIAAHFHDAVGEQRERADRPDEAVREQESPLSWRERAVGALSSAHEPLDQVAHVPEGAASQVGDLQVVAQHVIAIELDERVQVQEAPQACHRRDEQGGRMNPRSRIRGAPGEHRERPHHELHVQSRETHEQPFRAFGEEPGVVDVAVEGRVEVDQHEPQLVYRAAEMLAGHAVGGFVRRPDQQDHEQHGEERRDADRVAQVPRHVRRVADRQGRGEYHEADRERPEAGGEAEADTRRNPREHPVGVEEREPQIQQRAAQPSPAAGTVSRARGCAFQQPGFRQIGEERPQRRVRERRTERGLGSAPYDVHRRGAVQLLRDEVLSFPKTKEAAGRGVLHNEEPLAGRLARYDRQIAPKPRRSRGGHDMERRGRRGFPRRPLLATSATAAFVRFLRRLGVATAAAGAATTDVDGEGDVPRRDALLEFLQGEVEVFHLSVPPQETHRFTETPR